MEIKRKIEILVETKRRLIIRQPESSAQIICALCSEPMLTAEQTAALLGISRRAVYRLVEAESAHFAEIETGVVMLCVPSLVAILGDPAKQLPDAAT